jgi:HTH-type transcriptional regulator, sugar sensing transcriptional regulator
MDEIACLMQFGFTRQEATIYLALLSEGNLNGYEVAKTTGISRSNTYTSLAALVDKGAAYTVESDVIRYTPVSVEEFCDNKIRKLNDIKRDLLISIPQKKGELEGYITIKGQDHILNKIKNMIYSAEQRIYISLSKEVYDKVLDDIRDAIDRGIKIVLIINKPVKLEGATVYLVEKSNRQIRVITDSTNVLTGDIDDGNYSTCLFSRKKNLIDLLKDSLKNEIKLIEMKKEGCSS